MIFDTALQFELVPLFGVTNVIEGKIELARPEKRQGIEALALAQNIARHGLALAFGHLCLPKTSSGMTRGWVYGNEAADGGPVPGRPLAINRPHHRASARSLTRVWHSLRNHYFALYFPEIDGAIILSPIWEQHVQLSW